MVHVRSPWEDENAVMRYIEASMVDYGVKSPKAVTWLEVVESKKVLSLHDQGGQRAIDVDLSPDLLVCTIDDLCERVVKPACEKLLAE